jgi:hypothetical protein
MAAGVVAAAARPDPGGPPRAKAEGKRQKAEVWNELANAISSKKE